MGLSAEAIATIIGVLFGVWPLVYALWKGCRRERQIHNMLTVNNLTNVFVFIEAEQYILHPTNFDIGNTPSAHSIPT
jgi:hypothetical protein